MEAVDSLISTRGTVYNIAAHHGSRATLAPRLCMDALKPFVFLFLQFLLSHLPAVCTLSLPIDASYLSMHAGAQTGPTPPANCETSTHLSDTRKNYRFEVQCLNATAHTYLAVAAIFESGMRGVRECVKLTVEGVQGVPANLCEDDRERKGVRGRLLLSRKEAMGYLVADKELSEFFGREFVEKYQAVNEALSTTLRDDDPAKELKKLVEMY